MEYILGNIHHLFKANVSWDIHVGQEYQRYWEEAASTHQDSSYIVREYFSQDGEWRCHGSSKANCIHWANDKAENDELCPSLSPVQQAVRERSRRFSVVTANQQPKHTINLHYCTRIFGMQSVSHTAHILLLWIVRFIAVPHMFFHEWSEVHIWTSFPTFIGGAISLRNFWLGFCARVIESAM